MADLPLNTSGVITSVDADDYIIVAPGEARVTADAAANRPLVILRDRLIDQIYNSLLNRSDGFSLRTDVNRKVDLTQFLSTLNLYSNTSQMNAAIDSAIATYRGTVNSTTSGLATSINSLTGRVATLEGQEIIYKGNWVSGTNYNTGDVVRYVYTPPRADHDVTSMFMFISGATTVALNVADDNPTEHPEYWANITVDPSRHLSIPMWDATRDYGAGEMVEDLVGALWFSRGISPAGTLPTQNNIWQKLTPGPRNWTSNQEFNSGEIITYNGKAYLVNSGTPTNLNPEIDNITFSAIQNPVLGTTEELNDGTEVLPRLFSPSVIANFVISRAADTGSAVVSDGTLSGTGQSQLPLRVTTPFTEAEKTKLGGIAANATANPNALDSVATDATLSGDGTAGNPLSVLGGGGGGSTTVVEADPAAPQYVAGDSYDAGSFVRDSGVLYFAPSAVTSSDTGGGTNRPANRSDVWNPISKHVGNYVNSNDYSVGDFVTHNSINYLCVRNVNEATSTPDNSDDFIPLPTSGSWLFNVVSDETLSGTGRIGSALRVAEPYTAAERTKLAGVEDSADANPPLMTQQEINDALITEGRLVSPALIAANRGSGGGGGGAPYTRTPIISGQDVSFTQPLVFVNVGPLTGVSNYSDIEFVVAAKWANGDIGSSETVRVSVEYWNSLLNSAIGSSYTANASSTQYSTIGILIRSINAYDSLRFGKTANGSLLVTNELGTERTFRIQVNGITYGGGGSGSGLASVATDSTITGDGTTDSPLSVANEFTDADELKLDGIEAGADVNRTNAELKTDYESNADTNAFTDAEKTKLADIATAATSNPNALDSVSVDATLSGIGTSASPLSVANPFTAQDEAKLDGIEAGADVNPTAAEIASAYEGIANVNRFTDADHTKLDGIEAGAQQNVGVEYTQTEKTKLAGVSTGANVGITSVASDATLTGNGTSGNTLKVANPFTAADESKLDGIQAGAQVNPTATQIASAYEGISGVNRFTNADHTKLDGIATGAEVNPAPMTQAELDTGTSTAERVITPQLLANNVGEDNPAVVTQNEIDTGTSTEARLVTPAILAGLGGSGGGGGGRTLIYAGASQTAAQSALSTNNRWHDFDFLTIIMQGDTFLDSNITQDPTRYICGITKQEILDRFAENPTGQREEQMTIGGYLRVANIPQWFKASALFSRSATGAVPAFMWFTFSGTQENYWTIIGENFAT